MHSASAGPDALVHDARVRAGNFVDVNGTARAGHGNKCLAGAADEFALDIARGLSECVQAGRGSWACWTGRTLRASWADAAACTVRTR